MILIRYIIPVLASIILVFTNALADKPGLVFQIGHRSSSKINNIVVHPNNKIMATSATDRTIILWDIPSANVISNLYDENGHTADIINMSFSSTGDTLVSVGLDNKIILWDIKKRKILTSFIGKALYFTGGILVPENRIIISTSRSSNKQGNIEFWDIITSNSFTKIIQNYFPNDLLIINKQFFATFNNNSTNVDIWNISHDSNTPSIQLKGLKKQITDFSASDNGFIVAIDNESNICVWHYEDPTAQRNFNFNSIKIALSPDSKLIATLNKDLDSIHIINAINGNIIFTHKNAIKKTEISELKFSADSKVLFYGTDNGQIVGLNIDEKSIFQFYRGVNQKITASALSDDERFAVFTINQNNENYCLVYDFVDFVIDNFFKLDLIKINDIKFQKNNNIFAICGKGFAQKSIEIFDLQNRKFINSRFLENNVLSCDYSINNDFFAFTSTDSLKIFNTQQNIFHSAICLPDNSSILEICFHPTQNTIALGSDNGGIYLYNILQNNLELISEPVSASIIEISFSESGDSVIALNNKSDLIIYNLKKQVLSDNNLCHSKDCRLVEGKVIKDLLITISSDKRINVYNISKKLELTTSIYHSHNQIDCKPLMLDKYHFMITGGTEGLIKFWNLKRNNNEYTYFIENPFSWAFISEQGFFDGTYNGISQFHWFGDSTMVEVSSYFEELFHPLLLDNTLRFLSSEYINKTTIKLGNTPLPKVNFDRNIISETVDSKDYSFSITIIPADAAIENLYLYHNTKLIRKIDLLARGNNQTAEQFEIELLNGENNIEIQVVDIYGRKSNPIRRNIKYESNNTNRTFVLFLGNDCQKEPERIDFVQNNVTHLSEIFLNTNKNNNIYIYSCINEDATQDALFNIIDSIKSIAQASDYFICYYNGCVELSNDQNKSMLMLKLMDNNLSFDIILDEISEIKSLRQLFIFDIFKFNEKSTDKNQKKENNYYLLMKYYASLSKLYGINILSSSLTSLSNDFITKEHHSIFTNILIDGLNGGADLWKGRDGMVTKNELFLYINDKMKSFKDIKNINSYLFPMSFGNDLILIDNVSK